MLTTVSCSQARRRLRRLIALVAQGHSFVITKNGRAICRLEGAEAIQVDHGASCKASLVLDQVSCYRCARLVKLARAMAGFANQYHLCIAITVEHCCKAFAGNIR